MQNRDYKIFRKNEYYHVYNRGNQKQNIFRDDSDYLNFIKRCVLTLNIGPQLPHKLNIKPLPSGCLNILSYCLMPNHFHFIIKQNSEIGINHFISKVCTSYASYFNKKYNQVGHLFQDAFKAKTIDNDEYLTYLSAYIHNNPENPLLYKYSSLLEITNPNQEYICQGKIILDWFGHNPDTYRNFVLTNKNCHPVIDHLLFNED